jgi:hypothetical protein
MPLYLGAGTGFLSLACLKTLREFGAELELIVGITLHIQA